ncbi:hypothetical protein ACFQX9_37925 [Bradyrhizobium sp. GCM10028915]|uniref:hypothetical protein n=1 Tax=Bradyrhizobium sp. GCM10028915 TaxID=3273385 RepID=UPI00360DEF39
MTLAEIADHLLKEYGEYGAWCGGSSIAAISTFKKIARERPGLAGSGADRATWKASQPEIESGRLVFIDETMGASTTMARLYGHSPRGQRCGAALPHAVGGR